jgi:hypothetical protein
MKQFVDIIPTCEECDGELCLIGIQVDLVHCCYILFLECIVCGEERIIILDLEDFIEISNCITPPNNN